MWDCSTGSMRQDFYYENSWHSTYSTCIEFVSSWNILIAGLKSVFVTERFTLYNHAGSAQEGSIHLHVALHDIICKY